MPFLSPDKAANWEFNSGFNLSIDFCSGARSSESLDIFMFKAYSLLIEIRESESEDKIR